MAVEIKLNHTCLPTGKIYQGDVLETLKGFPSESVDCIVTSPPYWGLRDYGKETYKIWDERGDCEHDFEVIETKRPNASGGKTDYARQKLAINGSNNYSEFVDYHKRVTKSSFCKKCSAWYGQLGLEPTLDMYLDHLLLITQELKRVLKPTGIMFWNHGDCYGSTPVGKFTKNWDALRGRDRRGFESSGILDKTKSVPQKCMALQNYRLITKMIDQQGWILRNIIIWHKPNHMPSSVKDRFANAYEPVFMFIKQSKPQYYYNTKSAVMVDRKPEELKEGTDWDWKDCPNCEGTGKTIEDIEVLTKEADEYIEQEKGEKCNRCKGTGKIKVSHWRSLNYWFDLDVVRKPIAEATKKRAKSPFYPDHWKAKVWRKTQKRGGRDAQTFNKEVYAKIANGEKTMANPGDLWQQDLPYVEIPEDLFQEINKFTDAHPEIDYGWFTDLIREIMFKQYIPKDLWTISTQPCPQAHFATFPEKLIEPMIKAGCPFEICTKCGKARVRISKVEGESTTEKIKRLGASGKRGEFERKQALDYAGGHGSNIRPRETIGFTNCSCNVEGNKWKAGIVLDPFMGAGTTGLVAKKLGRNFIGIELNPKYVQMARERIESILF